MTPRLGQPEAFNCLVWFREDVIIVHYYVSIDSDIKDVEKIKKISSCSCINKCSKERTPRRLLYVKPTCRTSQGLLGLRYGIKWVNLILALAQRWRQYFIWVLYRDFLLTSQTIAIINIDFYITANKIYNFVHKSKILY